MLKINNLVSRKVLRVNNLLWRSMFYDQLLTTPYYDLCFSLDKDYKFTNCAVNLQFSGLDAFRKEVPFIEKYFTSMNKPSSIYLSDFDEPRSLGAELEVLGYKRDEEEDGLVWGLEYDDFNEIKVSENIEIVECRTEEQLGEYLLAAHRGYNSFDYTRFASSVSKLFNTHIDGVTQMHYIAYVDNKPVAAASVGICCEIALFVNTAVVPEYRKQGIHTALMQHRIVESHKLGAKQFFYITDVDNVASIGTGGKFGFEKAFRQYMWYKNVHS